MRKLLDCLVFNGTSTQKGQFAPTVGRETGSGGYDGQRDTFVTLHDNNATHFNSKNTLVTQTQQPAIESYDLVA